MFGMVCSWCGIDFSRNAPAVKSRAEFIVRGWTSTIKGLCDHRSRGSCRTRSRGAGISSGTIDTNLSGGSRRTCTSSSCGPGGSGLSSGSHRQTIDVHRGTRLDGQITRSGRCTYNIDLVIRVQRQLHLQRNWIGAHNLLGDLLLVPNGYTILQDLKVCSRRASSSNRNQCGCDIIGSRCGNRKAAIRRGKRNS